MDPAPVIYLCGPTAVGKTKVAIQLAQVLNCAILSFDSRQFYSELAIGAAPPDAKELSQAEHHFIQHLQLTQGQEWNAAEFAEAAREKIKALIQHDGRVLLVGGSGLYLRALLQGFDEMPQVQAALREELGAELANNGLAGLYEELKLSDPEYAAQVDPQNPQRILRALEVIRSSGKPYSSFLGKGKNALEHAHIGLGLEMDRRDLYQRINQRVLKMLEAGLEDEAKSLYPYRHCNALQTMGYREWWPYLEGNSSLENVVAEIQKNSRRYAKRQLTWFKNQLDIPWFKPDELDRILEHLKSHGHAVA